MDVTHYRKKKSSPFPSCLTPSLLWLQTKCWKKVSLIVFRQILPKVFPVVHIFSFIITTYLKKFAGIKFFSTKQCPAESFPWIIPHISPFYQRCIISFHLACCRYHILTALPLPPNLPFWRNPVDGGRIPPHQQIKMLTSHTRSHPPH